jgi:hypothetical protein
MAHGPVRGRLHSPRTQPHPVPPHAIPPSHHHTRRRPQQSPPTPTTSPARSAFEAGADDTLTLAVLGGQPQSLALPDAARWAVAALLTASLAPPVLNEAEALRLGVASNLALVGAIEGRHGCDAKGGSGLVSWRVKRGACGEGCRKAQPPASQGDLQEGTLGGISLRSRPRSGPVRVRA